MKKIIIIIVVLFLDSCGSSKTATQVNTQDKPEIVNSEVIVKAPVKVEPTPKVVEASVTKDTLFIALTDPSDIEKGKNLFNNNACSTCHRTDAGGMIGPNLTDEHTISGCNFEDIYTIIAKGKTNSGMNAYEKQLSKKEIQQVTSYILTLQGTTPEKPKRPQGEPCTE